MYLLNQFKLYTSELQTRYNHTTLTTISGFVNIADARYIEKVKAIHSPAADGNYGFRIMSMALNGGQEKWKNVKADMLSHLEHRKEFYINIWGIMAVKEVELILIDRTENQLDNSKWFSVTECAQVASNTYNVAIVTYSIPQHLLFLPLFGVTETVRAIILQLHNSHFYFVELIPRQRMKWPKVYPGYQNH